MKAFIFANGAMDAWPAWLENPCQDDLVICADGGLKHCLRLGLTPHMVVGDMDSALPDDLAGLPGWVKIIRHPERKDETDLELALSLAAEQKAAQVIILGALGRRWDMSLSNVLLLASHTAQSGQVIIIEHNQRIICLKGPKRHTFMARAGEVVSLLPLGGEVSGITFQGMEYPLNNATLRLGDTRGISNIVKSVPASVEFDKGVLLVVIGRG
jgi:thiamine pyrophosphokinase